MLCQALAEATLDATLNLEAKVLISLGVGGFIGNVVALPIGAQPEWGGGTNQKQRRMSGCDAGDFYLTPSGKRTLHRLPGQISVHVAEGAEPAAVLSALTAPGAPLAGGTPDCKPSKGFLLLKA